MKTKKTNIYSDLVQQFHENLFTDRDILNELNEKPICVHINELKSQYEDSHRHDYYELLYVEKGSICYSIDDNEYIVNPGSLLIIPPLTSHYLKSFNETNSSRFIILFSKKFLKKYSTKNTDLLILFNSSLDNNNHMLSFYGSSKIELEKNLFETSNIMLKDDYGADIFYIHKFIRNLIVISTESKRINKEDSLLNNKNTIISQIATYIDNNISQKIVIDDIAKHLSLSTSRISHIFKSETGISLLKYINKRRMFIAKELIYKGVTFINIANDCGFQDYTSFFRTFKKEVGITPGEYAKSIRIFTE